MERIQLKKLYTYVNQSLKEKRHVKWRVDVKAKRGKGPKERTKENRPVLGRV